MSREGPNKGEEPGLPEPQEELDPADTENAVCNNNVCKNNGHDDRPIVITGGAGFIGTNLAHRLLSAKRRVILFDNLSRSGVEQNLDWLREVHGGRVQHVLGDVRDAKALRETVAEASQVFHLAAQVAVTSSLEDPIEDFEINARGTLNLLEALRGMRRPPPLVFTSTNKVYGDLKQFELQLRDGRYEPEAKEIRRNGFSESQPLHFHSPYGCSKGAACQYVLDYARTFGLPTVVFRMSCIYGPHQFGTEDQGWLAHFLIRALHDSPITVYGNGHQVRDILFVEDLVNAFLLAQKHMHNLQGQVFNIGGGPRNTISLLELLGLIQQLNREKPKVSWATWRAADQKYYVSDTRKFSSATGWTPTVGVREGVERLYAWLRDFNATPLGLTRVRVSSKPLKLRITHLRRTSVSASLRPNGTARLKINRRINGKRRNTLSKSPA